MEMKMGRECLFVGVPCGARTELRTVWAQASGQKCQQRRNTVRCESVSGTTRLQKLARSAAGIAFAVALNFSSGSTSAGLALENTSVETVQHSTSEEAVQNSASVEAVQNSTSADITLNPLKLGDTQTATRIIDDPESILRWALPFNNGVVRELQEKLEDVRFDLRDSKWDSVTGHVRRACDLVRERANDILVEIAPEDAEEVKQLLGEINTRLQRLSDIVAEKSVEKVITLEKEILRQLDKVEEALVKKFPFEVPEEYKYLPQLRGRATVEMKLKRNDEAGRFRIGAKSYESATMTIVVDGYSAPITAGNFVDLVRKGFYRRMEIKGADDTLVKAGDPDGEPDGYIDPKTEKVRRIPLEIKRRGATAPIYGQPLNNLPGNPDQQLTLPFSAYGTVAMVHDESSPNTASSQFFWFLDNLKENSDRNLTPDGRYAAFGYVVDGEWFLREVQAGDIIVEAKVTSGLDKLIAAKDVTDYKGAELERG
eukprot:Plantae.Rhodophyta-Purpureofilum_apyrenoidigerum.ctg8000.p1 GENE.Plantae.Rhodophyta-Purpureofilum_apyrenoidigerum.ctg8000~~Plantae.Rhodophyta-Purpureofilum_apyrenoidigerum.ctg8000.p1  ORF type:complete len:495 (-),score=94.52 Plantae.Rhodophyta-Purpureofilum_apyrenoidigerum.ctg8000:40-1491(-)